MVCGGGDGSPGTVRETRKPTVLELETNSVDLPSNVARQGESRHNTISFGKVLNSDPSSPPLQTYILLLGGPIG
jgi:hypothetical protein